MRPSWDLASGTRLAVGARRYLFLNHEKQSLTGEQSFPNEDSHRLPIVSSCHGKAEPVGSRSNGAFLGCIIVTGTSRSGCGVRSDEPPSLPPALAISSLSRQRGVPPMASPTMNAVQRLRLIGLLTSQ
jgi:hypothetical protein